MRVTDCCARIDWRGLGLVTQ